MNLSIKCFRLLFCLAALCCLVNNANAVPIDSLKHVQAGQLSLSTFDVDATPPVGSDLAYDPMINSWDMSLRAKGFVLMGSGKPIVVCSVDWIGISNDSQDEFKAAIASAAGTTTDRVAVHALHIHDAPACDFGAERILLAAGLKPISFEGSFAREVIRRLAVAVHNSIKKAQPVTHLGLGKAVVYKVSSNRRIIGADGKVKASRTSATKDSAMRAEPEGLIDPELSLISFWNKDKPVAVLSYYATHPQSYYRTGVPNPDFPGLARFMRQLAVPDALHIHFNGAGGNITAGKYNDGAHINRLILAERLADGMKRAWEATKKEPIDAAGVEWTIEPIKIPLKKDVVTMEQKMYTETPVFLSNNMSKLVLLRREEAGKKIDITCLKLGNARILHLPGEPFVEYQLAAKAYRKDLFVALAGYGDYAPGYICNEEGYRQGGYEAGQASAANPDIEKVLMTAIHKLLKK
ncbi:hypothetical protein [Pedobacter heparinus]|uniref:Signal peptide n=1 Tax=Pedobacter heparinus (strain ATCC 13125 / DSM 2366 / CIP 104194 / JCM 7457 / NBRC 12017 / NCIMB 9290 / NRRL B-14731 / HIM 762-3) TaxID=485917 RepID=C6XZ95_PEDHD|nr:hypothetical protein [Pedobacter heparinus]ACU02577.1 signal peptide [Pedobacter heparinus DSM 2366]